MERSFPARRATLFDRQTALQRGIAGRIRAGAQFLPLYQVLGGKSLAEHLMGFLTFIRAAHYWTVLHPELLL